MFSHKLVNCVKILPDVLHPPCQARALSALPSMSEATEAIEHIGDAEQRLNASLSLESVDVDSLPPPKLDKNGHLWLTYSVVGPARLDDVNSLLYAIYYPDEPIHKHLGLYNGQNSIPDGDRLVKRFLPKHLSLFAHDSNGSVVGVCINNAYFRSEFEQDLENGLDQVIDPSYKPMLAMYHQLRMNNKHIYDELKTEKFFSIRMVGIDPKMRGRGVATDLIRRSILLAGCLGFSGIKTETTGEISKKAFSTVGMLKTNSIKYADFEFEGKKVFEGMDPQDNEMTFMKKKFFQNCLKHIM